MPSALAATRVLFGEKPEPLLYVSAGQIGAIVPYGVAGRTTVDVVVLFGTGEGQTFPAGQDGVLTGAETARPVLPVRVTIGGKEEQG